jgi:hypothetical protein
VSRSKCEFSQCLEDKSRDNSQSEVCVIYVIQVRMLNKKSNHDGLRYDGGAETREQMCEARGERWDKIVWDKVESERGVVIMCMLCECMRSHND